MSDRLIYLPLGGAGEIGMNAYVYGYGPKGKERLIVIDLGVTFGDMDSTPGVDLIMADTAWLQANKNRIEAIFITHAHHDHIQGVAEVKQATGANVTGPADARAGARRAWRCRPRRCTRADVRPPGCATGTRVIR